MLALPTVETYKWNVLLFAKLLNSFAKATSITHQGSVAHVFITTFHYSVPVSNSARNQQHRAISIQYDSINTIICTFQ